MDRAVTLSKTKVERRQVTHLFIGLDVSVEELNEGAGLVGAVEEILE